VCLAWCPAIAAPAGLHAPPQVATASSTTAAWGTDAAAAECAVCTGRWPPHRVQRGIAVGGAREQIEAVQDELDVR